MFNQTLWSGTGDVKPSKAAQGLLNTLERVTDVKPSDAGQKILNPLVLGRRC